MGDYTKIKNPDTGKWVDINKVEGRKVLTKYITESELDKKKKKNLYYSMYYAF